MKKQNLVLGLILSGCAAAVACTSSGDDTVGTGGTAGSTNGGSAGSAAGGASAGTHAGGTAGSTNGGSAGESTAAGTGGSVSNAGASPGGEGGEGGAPVTGNAGEGGEGGEAGAPVVVVQPQPLNPQFVLVPAAAPVAPNHLLIAGTNYATTEVASVTIDAGTVGTTTTYTDGDSIPVSSAGLGFVLERTNDKAHLLDGGTVKTTFDLTDPGTATTALTDNKAYVGLFNQSLISILDLTANKVSRRIDLSAFNDPSDADGSADIVDAAYDPIAKIAYFVLARIDLTTIVAPDYTLPCGTSKSLVVGINTTTDAVVDLNGSSAGQALELSLASPQSIAIDATGKLLTVTASGCYDGATLAHNGVEVLSLDTGVSTVAYAGTSDNSPRHLILLGGGAAVLETQDSSYTDHWFTLDLSTGVLGSELLNVPSSPSFDGTDLLGVRVSGKVGAVVRYDIATDTVTDTISATSWTGQYSTAYGTALVQ